jgi:hypothetical protein
MALNTAKDVQVNATFYDTNGKVVGSTRAFTEPEDLRFGENATCSILLNAILNSLKDILN